MEPLQLFGTGQVEQRELHAGESLVEAAQNAREPCVCGRGDNTDAERPHQPVLGFLDAFLGLRGGGEDRACLIQEHPSRVSQIHRTGVAIQQTQFEFVFQRLDLGAQRRLGQAQPLGGAPEIQLLSHRYKVAQMSQFHRIDIFHLSVREQTSIGERRAKEG